MRILSLLLGLLILTGGCIAANPRNLEGGEPALVTRYVGPALADPLREGPYSFSTRDYDQGIVKVGGRTSAHSNYTYDARIRGVLYAPQGEGPFPILLFLHGQHSTCGLAGREAFIGPPTGVAQGNCEGPAPWHPYPNHQGYAYLAAHLASHGYVVASILAKEINDRNGNPDVGMWARGELVIATLDTMKMAHEGAIDLGLAGKIDFQRIGLMGHSRGGEGVVTATHVNAERADPYPIGAVIPLAPTDFNRRGVEGAAVLSLVPYCDGDVFSLHGLRTYDHSIHLDQTHAKVQVLVYGANHNNYNTQWGRGEVAGVVREGDDAPPGRHANPDCDLNRNAGGGRLTSDDTLREGILHMAGFFRWVLGEEHALGPYFTGEAAMPSNTCPGRAAQCPDAVLVSAALPGRQVLFNVDTKGVLLGNATDVELAGFDTQRVCSLATCAPNMYSSARALDLAWSRSAKITAAVDGISANMDALVFRLGVAANGETNQPSQPLEPTVTLVDKNGTRVSVRVTDQAALEHPPGELFEKNEARVGQAKVSLNMVRVPLAAFPIAGADVAQIEITFDKPSTGRVFFSELFVQPETRIPVSAASAIGLQR